VDPRKKRVAVGGLRTADPNTLSVLTQDVLRLPASQIDRNTLVDLLALAEIPDQVGGQLAIELGRFRDQMFREFADLPDGPPLAEFCAEIGALPASQVPEGTRAAIGGLLGDLRTEEARDGVSALITHWESEAPAALVIPVAAPAVSPAKLTGAGKPRKEVVKPKAKPTRKRTTTKVDSRREEWIREDSLSRLGGYGARGLKQSIIVGGARHRSPWPDLTEAEVLTILRKMKREGRVRFSAGRWMIGG
jgi:hypothetical protein